MPNSWRIMVSYMGIWLVANDGVMFKVDELIYLNHLTESKEHEYYELVPWGRRTRIVKKLPLSFRYWKSRFFFVSGDNFETPFSKVWGELPRLHNRWGTPTLGVSLFLFSSFKLGCVCCSCYRFLYLLLCIVKRQPKLKSRYKKSV